MQKSSVPISLGLMGFAVRLVNSVLNLSNKQVKFFGDFNLQKNYNHAILIIKIFLGLVEIIFWASKCYALQLAHMASCKTDFLCILGCGQSL